jgi:hypothetical protein
MKDGRHEGALHLLAPKNFPSAAVPAGCINAALASFDSTSTTFFSVKRQYENGVGIVLFRPGPRD